MKSLLQVLRWIGCPGAPSLGLALVLLMTGCGRDGTSAGKEAPGVRGGGAPLPPSARIFPTRGVVREIVDGGRKMVVRHEDIPGFMPAMVMELTAKTPSELVGLSPGDTVTFELVALEDQHWIQFVKRAETVPVETVKPLGPLVLAQPLAAVEPGGLFPDVEIRDETGRMVKLSSMRGSAVALTFFFTKCPLPDFCPRMLKHFRTARNQLLTTSEGPTNWLFLSLSFDYDADTPEVLKQHAVGYRGSEVGRWYFGAADTNAMSVLIPSVHLMVAREAETFSHNLRTVVLDTQGRLYRRFDGNEWSPADLAAAMREACHR